MTPPTPTQPPGKNALPNSGSGTENASTTAPLDHLDVVNLLDGGNGHADGHTAGTAPKSRGTGKGFRHAQDVLSVASVAPRRLLSLEEGARYVGLSFWSFRELVNGGDVPLIRVPRPRTMRQHKRGARSDTLRRTLVDVRDLDALIDRWREARDG